MHALRETGPAKDQLRFLTCGSVDDGKSTLIGRLLYDTKMIYRGPAAGARSATASSTAPPATTSISRCWSTGWRPSASRASPSTSPIASSPRRAVPSWSRTRRAMSSTPATWRPAPPMRELAVILIDARKGVLTQTRRHSFICSLLGIRHVVLAVNKIDLVDYRQGRVRPHRRRTMRRSPPRSASPRSCRSRCRRAIGDNIINRSAHDHWYHGPRLLDYLETASTSDARRRGQPFRFPVQWVNRPNLDFRGYAGTIASGRIAVGDEIVVAASGRNSRDHTHRHL